MELNKIMFGNGKGRQYLIPSDWSGQDSYYCECFLMESELDKYGKTFQDWYDRFILKIDDPNDRPKCKWCGKELEFLGISKGYKDFCDKSCRVNYTNNLQWNDPNSIVNSESYRDKLRLSTIRRWSDPNSNFNSEEFRINLSNKIRNLWSDPNSSYNDKDYLNSQISNLLNSYKGKTFTYESLKGGKCVCRSTWEYKYIIDLDNNPEVMRFESETLRIPYENKGSIHHYVPDFLVFYKDRVELVEIKPFKLIDDEINQLKFKSAFQYCLLNGYKFVILTEVELFS